MNPWKAAAVVPAAWQEQPEPQCSPELGGSGQAASLTGLAGAGGVLQATVTKHQCVSIGLPADELLVPRGTGFKGSHRADPAGAAPNKGWGEPPTTAKRNLEFRT